MATRTSSSINSLVALLPVLGTLPLTSQAACQCLCVNGRPSRRTLRPHLDSLLDCTSSLGTLPRGRGSGHHTARTA
jgi:hypothetical protein